MYIYIILNNVFSKVISSMNLTSEKHKCAMKRSYSAENCWLNQKEVVQGIM